MKKTFSFLFIAVLLCSLASCDISQHSKSTYKDVEGGAALYRYKGNSSETSLIIEDETGGKKVVELMRFCAANNEYLKNVKIGANVERISEWAFTNCAALEKFEVSENNRFFEADENGVLYTKGKIELVFYPNSRENLKKDSNGNIIGGGEITIPGTVAKIRNNAFYLCGNLYRISLQEGLKEIGSGAFLKCENLNNFILPATLEIIGDDGFSYCNSLTEVTVPAGVMSIGNYAFFSSSSIIKQITLKRPIDEIDCGKDWVPYQKGSSGTKVEVVFVQDES